MKRNIFFLIPLLVLFSLFFGYIKIKNLFVNDSMVKLVQAKSILELRTIEPEFLYLARSMDPNYQLNPYHHWLNEVDGKIVAPFPTSLNLTIALLIYIFKDPNILYFFSSIIAFCTFYIIYRQYGLNYFFASLFCTSIFWHSLLFIDVAICLMILLIVMTRFFESDRLLSKLESIFYSLLIIYVYSIRPEYFGFFVIAFLTWIFISETGIGILIAEYRLFIVCCSFFLLLLILYNQIQFDHPLGMRYLSNRVGIFNQLDNRLTIISSLLFLNKVRLGFFGFMPVFFLILLISVYFRKVLEKKERFYLLVIVFYFIVLSIISPNDSWIDWGSRYLTPAIFPFLSLYFYFDKRDWHRSVKIGLRLLLLLTLLLNIVLFKLLSSNVKTNTKFVSFVSSTTSDLNIFRDELLISYSGFLYFEKPVILVKNQSDEELIKKILLDSKIPTVSIYSFQHRENQNFTPNCYFKITETNFESIIRQEYTNRCK